MNSRQLRKLLMIAAVGCFAVWVAATPRPTHAAAGLPRPDHVVICVGSGPQEKLGLFLKRELSYGPGIHCLGAAIGFLSGEQASIPAWADRAYLGWLLRCIDDPRTFVPRYLKAFRLVYLLARYGATPPPIVSHAG